MAEVKEGDKAPDFTLRAQDGRVVSLHDFLGAKNVVVYFYPKDFTMGCTAEAKKFSENYGSVRSMDAEVIGISSDTAQSHEHFAEECGVDFPLLSDEAGSVRRDYGVKASLGLVPGRVTFVIDKHGIIRHIYSSQTHPKRHVAEALEALKSMPN